MDNRPIGIFDSGIGGLSVWREVRLAMPSESVVYFGDGKNCPYGTKPEEDIIGFTLDGVRSLMDRGAKIIVLACNTATAAAVATLREMYPGFPFVGMEPALKPAVEATRTGKVAVIATIAYLASEGFTNLVERHGQGVEVLASPGVGFAMMVEQEMNGTPEALQTVSEIIEPLIDTGADTLVLGCTHYPFLSADIRQVIGDRELTLINPAPAVARRVGQLLGQAGTLASPDNIAQLDFISVAGGSYNEKLRATAMRALSMDI